MRKQNGGGIESGRESSEPEENFENACGNKQKKKKF